MDVRVRLEMVRNWDNRASGQSGGWLVFSDVEHVSDAIDLARTRYTNKKLKLQEAQMRPSDFHGWMTVSLGG